MPTDLSPKNASEAKGDAFHKILVLGTAGVGKTTQFLTLPGRKFIYLFDPNAIESLKGYDVDYLEYLPDRLPLNVTSLSKGKGDKRTIAETAAATYRAFEEHAEAALSQGFFDAYSVIGFDSMTTLLDLIMDRILEINGRAGEWPQQDDYGPQMKTFSNIVRTFTSQGKVLYFTGHIEMQRDDVSKKVTWQPLMTGRLRVKTPLLFTSTFRGEADTDREGESNYTLQTKPTREFPLCRTSIKPAPKFMENVNLDFSKPLEGQGLARLLGLNVGASKKLAS